MWFTNGLSVTSNKFSSCGSYGAYVWYSNYTLFTQNWVWNNTCGLSFRDSPTGAVYNNSFVNNTQYQATVTFDVATCEWDRGGIGNYWSDYTNKYPQATNDNVTWNLPYIIKGKYMDEHPLVRPHDVPLPAQARDYSPIASFAIGNAIVIANSMAQFIFTGNVGNAPASFQWNFGDGSANSTYESPSYAYKTAGTYSVALTITDVDGDTSTVTRADCITILPDYYPVANFTVSASTISPGSSVTFMYTGTEGNSPLSLKWYLYGSNVSYAYTRNPTVIYPKVGTYHVILWATDVDGDKCTLVRANCVTVTDNATPADLQPVASFSVNASRVVAGQDVSFTYTGITGDGTPSYQWCFGDGSANDTRRDPVHRFVTPGSYLVRLTVVDQDGDVSTTTAAFPVVVEADVAPVARFSQNASLIMVNQTIQYRFSGSEGNAPATLRWNFGDGSPVSCERNPRHRYASWGVYNVTLEVVDRDGDRSTVVVIASVVVLPRIFPQAMFSVQDLESGASYAKQFTFTGDQAHGLVSREWMFGDGTVSNEENPVHVYARPGDYNVTLTITDIFGNTDTVSRVVSIITTPPSPGEEPPALPRPDDLPPGDILDGKQQQTRVLEGLLSAIAVVGLVIGIVAGRMGFAKRHVRRQKSQKPWITNNQASMALPGQAGLDLLQELRERDLGRPSVYTAYVIESEGNVRKLVVQHQGTNTNSRNLSPPKTSVIQ
ncbi:MAG: PKD domain-containing protein [Candidatus Sigynarchaeota archaeon]